MANMNEIAKLACMLSEANIPYELIPWKIVDEFTIQIVSPKKENCRVDAVCHKYSYGGDEGLLEVMGSANPNLPNEDVKGWMTANEAFQYFTEM